MPSPAVRVERLEAFAAALFTAAGMDADKAATVARLMVLTDMMGRRTHGLAMAPLYLAEIRKGTMRVTGRPQIVKDTGATMLWDGDYLPGLWLVNEAIETAMPRAAQSGVVTVAIRRSHHIGCLAALVKQAADKGFIAIIANSDPVGKARGALRRHGAAVHAQSVRGRLSDRRSSGARRHLRVDHDGVDDAPEIRGR